VTGKTSFVFMGTPDFAVPTLRKLHAEGLWPELVVTQPDRPKGRGRTPLPPPVKIAALELGCEVIQPTHMSDPGLKERLCFPTPDFFVVVAYGHILPSVLLSIPRVAAINLHASLLPKYRGAAPIQRALINGETETGVTTIKMNAGMDTGDILMTEPVVIDPGDTSETLHNRLSIAGATLVLKTIQGMLAGGIVPVPQNSENATFAPMLKKEDGRIDWSMPALQISNLIRGVTPWPGAFMFHKERRLKVYSVQTLPGPTPAAAGTVLETFPGELRIGTGDGILKILEIQGASGKRLPVQEFLRGYPLSPGDVFS
jgi:methionyl-tRNA formyltransferase